MWDRGIPFICHLDLAILHRVYRSFLQLRVPLRGCIVVEGGLDLGSLLVHKIDIEQGAGAPRVIPVFKIVFLVDLNFDDPVLSEGIKTANRHVHLIFRKIDLWAKIATAFEATAGGGWRDPVPLEVVGIAKAHARDALLQLHLLLLVPVRVLIGLRHWDA
jgi:hypothetical protein